MGSLLCILISEPAETYYLCAVVCTAVRMKVCEWFDGCRNLKCT